MALYLDSADVRDAQRAAALGFIAGVTTNPTLIAKTGQSAFNIIADLALVYPGQIFFQPSAQNMAGMLEEAERALRIAADRIVFKLPATIAGFQAGSRLRGRAMFGYTAIFTPAQVAVAAAAGATYILPYLSRMTRLMGDGEAVLRQMIAVARPNGVEVIVASVKTPEDAVTALLAGAQHVTAPLAVLEAMAASPLTDAAMDEFRRAVL